jgi:hypothetical protein
MSWKIALTVALLSALVTGAVTVPVAYKLTGMHGVSEFEGKRSMYVVFYFVPLAFIGGFLLGLLGSKLSGALEWSHFWKAAGLSIGLGQLLVWGVAGISTLSLPASLKSTSIALDVEALVPLARVNEALRAPGAIRMSLYAGDQDNRSVEVDTALYREENGHLVVVARAPLYSRSSLRILSFHLDTVWLAFDLPLPPEPTPTAQWSAPAAMRDATTSASNTVWSDVQLRYRVIDLGDTLAR